MTKSKNKELDGIRESLEQEDYYDSEYIDKVSDKYGRLIGLFIIKFNELEHEINKAIAKTFIDDDDSIGYRVVKLLNVNNKIDLFYEIYLEQATFETGKIKSLRKLKLDLDSVRIFRNKLVHANWSTLNREGYVRTKIESGKEDGTIQFVKVRILPKIIRKSISKLDSLIIKVWKYTE